MYSSVVLILSKQKSFKMAFENISSSARIAQLKNS